MTAAARRAGKGMTWFFLVVFHLIALIFVGLAAHAWWSWWELSEDGQAVEAEVVQAWTDWEGINHIRYRYEVDDEGFERHDQVSDDTIAKLRHRETIDVVYAPGRPSVATIELELSPQNAIALTVIALASLVVVGFQQRALRRRRRVVL